MLRPTKLSSAQRAEIFDKTVAKVTKDYFDPKFNGVDWPKLAREGYMLIMPKAQYITWQGHRFEGAGVKPEISVSWSVESFVGGSDNQLRTALDCLLGRTIPAATS